MGSNPCRKLSLLGFAHPIEGSPFQVHGAIEKAALIRGRLRRKSGCGFGSCFVYMYWNVVILVCVVLRVM